MVQQKIMMIWNFFKGKKLKKQTAYNFNCGQKKYKILIIEDSKFFNNAATKHLEADGHSIIQTFTLKEGIKALQSKEFDFVILDIILPDGGGEEIIDSMSESMRSKIIVLSGDEDAQKREYIFNSGILDYISKTNLFQVIMNDIKKLICKAEQNSLINILAIDDSSFTRKMLKKLLKPKRFNIYEANGAKSGLKILKEKEIHLILLDYEMPDINGIQMLEKIRKDVRFLNLPVIILSGSSNQDIVAKVLKHGANDFIKKPYIAEELLLKIDLHIKNYMDFQTIKDKERELKLSLERTKRAESYKSQFLSNMSHEIRTPLNSIMGFIEILQDEESDTKKLDYLNTIQDSGKLLLNLINDILDFSKIEDNKLNINKEWFNLSELHESIIAFYEHLFVKKGLTLNSSLDPTLPKYLYSDILRVKQIVINLLGNALKFTPKGGVVSFDIKQNRSLNSIEFSVKDSGIGIDFKNHKKIFEHFTQAEKETTKKFGGTGLGLSISAKLVKLLGGEIGVQSKLNQGSRFYFTIPVVDEKIDKELEKIDSEKKSESKDIKFSHRVLLVEDNKTNQQYMAILLKKLGLSFDIVDDGLEALKMFKKQKYDVILMDENMPNMGGMEATKEILKIEEGSNSQHTPIIALTANALRGDRERFLEAGMDEYLTKPINIKKLSDSLEKILEL